MEIKRVQNQNYLEIFTQLKEFMVFPKILKKLNSKLLRKKITRHGGSNYNDGDVDLNDIISSFLNIM